MYKRTLSLGITALLSVFILTYAAAQDQNSAPAETPQPSVVNIQDMPAQGGAVPAVQTEPEILWVWGEVTAVDALNKNFTLKYLDYETDQEKDISISVDDKTNYESVKALEGIKLKDTLSVDYLNQSGVNIAKNISLEKSDTQANEAPQMGTEEFPVPAAPAAPSQP